MQNKYKEIFQFGHILSETTVPTVLWLRQAGRGFLFLHKKSLHHPNTSATSEMVKKMAALFQLKESYFSVSLKFFSLLN